MNRSSSRLILPLLLVALIAAVGWWWTHTSGASGDAVPVTEVNSPAESLDNVEDLSLPDGERAGASEAPLEVRMVAETAEAAAGVPDSDAPGIRLHVVDAAGQSVPGAEVLFFQTVAPWASWGALQLVVGGLEASAEKLGEPDRFETDGGGFARLPKAWPSGLIWGRTGEAEAFVFVAAELEGDLELVLEPSVRVNVRIVDTAMKPRPGARTSWRTSRT